MESINSIYASKLCDLLLVSIYGILQVLYKL